MNSHAAAELAIIVVARNSKRWLGACLESVARHAENVVLDIVLVDNDSSDGTVSFVRSAFPEVRVIHSPNRGFAHANNVGLASTRTPFVLFLNPDTKIAEGTLRELLDTFAQRESLGVAGVRQIDGGGSLQYSIRRFPSVTRTFFQSIGSESFPVRAAWLGERVLDTTAYERESPCDWTSGSFMLIRREALDGAGLMDERFFLYAEEPDLCLRIARNGWEVRHVPIMTVIHFGGTTGDDPRLEAQEAFSRRLYMRKNFSSGRYVAGTAALAFGYALRALLGGKQAAERPATRAASRRALATLFGLAPPPFGEPPSQSVVLRSWGDGS